MKSLLIIGWVWPEPKSSAAGSRMLQLIKLFQQHSYRITFASPAQQTEHMEDLTLHDVQTRLVTLNCTSFDDFVSDLSPDIVMYDRYMMEEQFGWRVTKACPNALTLLDTEDLQSLRNARHQAIKQKRSATEADLHTDLAIREIAAIYRCDLSIMISQAEIELLTSFYGVDRALLAYLPFTFEQSLLNQINPKYSDRAHFISIGNFRHAPNWDAVLWLKQQIWPLIRKAIPDAELHIYGSYPPKKATDLHDEKSGFLVKGWVEDAMQAMQSAKVCLAPLRFGAGLKGKLAEAMLAGTPSVTTSIGAEGMITEHGWGGELAEDSKTIALHAIALYKSSDKWQQASALGSENARLLFSASPYCDEFTERIKKLLKDLPAHRRNNFVGLMLNHHSHKSTKYMSQWIEAKNKLT